jgi:hypothetical protein
MSEKYIDPGIIERASLSIASSAVGLEADYTSVKTASTDLSSAWQGEGASIKTEIITLVEGIFDMFSTISYAEAANLSKASLALKEADDSAAKLLSPKNPLLPGASTNH